MQSYQIAILLVSQLDKIQCQPPIIRDGTIQVDIQLHSITEKRKAQDTRSDTYETMSSSSSTYAHLTGQLTWN